MEKKLDSIKIGEIGTLNVSIPVITIGNSKPEVLIICGMHGDETSGLFIVKRLVQLTQKSELSFSVITAGNPLAQALQTRENPLDKCDLNRIFPGNVEKEGFSELNASKLFEFAKNFSLVIDLHTFSEPCLLTAIQTMTKATANGKRAIEAIKTFAPKVVWKLNTHIEKEVHFVGALGPVLAQNNIANFAVETPPAEILTEKLIQKIAANLFKVISLQEKSTVSTTVSKTKIPIISRHKFVASKAGFFEPTLEVGAQVKNGDTIGEITNLVTLETDKVIGKKSGLLIICKNRSIINSGDTVFSIGETVGSI